MSQGKRNNPDGKPKRDGASNTEAVSARARATRLMSTLDPDTPSFMKALQSSHLPNRYQMWLPAEFEEKHMPQKDAAIIIEDHEGKCFEMKYRSSSAQLGVPGWKQFCTAHRLDKGDVLVFQLVERRKPLKLKVHIFRAAAISAEVERTVGVLNLDSPAEIPETYVAPAGIVDPTPAGKRKRAKSADHSEEVGSEVSESSRVNELKVQFKDVATFEDFRILIDGVLVDSEFLEDTRRKYYDLCASQREFLHENLMERSSLRLITAAIFETVSIFDAIKACDLTTPRAKFSSWVGTLSALEVLGLNIGFMRQRVERLISLASESERLDEARNLAEAKHRRASVKEAIRKLELRVLELEEENEKLDTEIETLGSNARPTRSNSRRRLVLHGDRIP